MEMGRKREEQRSSRVHGMQDDPGSWTGWPDEDALGGWLQHLVQSREGVVVGLRGFFNRRRSIGDWHTCIWEMSCHGWQSPFLDASLIGNGAPNGRNCLGCSVWSASKAGGP